MKQKDKELLLQDLCSRLPYGVKVQYQVGSQLPDIKTFDGKQYDELKIGNYIDDWLKCTFKPYLFPISSMTEEQKKFFKDKPIFLDYENELVVKEDFFGNSQFTMLEDWVEVILWLLKNHFDYRGLIPKGLAIDCTNLNIY